MTKKQSPTTKLVNFVNKWARDNQRPRTTSNGLRTEYGEGYHQACLDIWDKCKQLGFTELWEKEMGYER